ncbi:translation machinery-associated protein 16 [Coemansia sp. RSA 1813]|nr:translation machinery-associated protein 16 [Coemansia sp. RSA 1646]KAJ1765404.1 translation machinery-associated protein 16 [Coemansia sp. RSA 1843]KAJ2573549.1 translation machinery-associated protein 16 [Coemansia sp. RSA 1813]
MPNNKRKRVSKIKGREKAHPYSRKARQISRAMHKESQIAKTKSDRLSGAMSKGQKVVWFRDNMDSMLGDGELEDDKKKKVWTKNELRELVSSYLKRNQDEVDELEEKEGKALTPKEALFLQVMETETKEARLAGIEVPDLTNGAVVKALRAWDGDVNSITTIKLITCKPLDAPSADATIEKSGKQKTGSEGVEATVSEDQAIANLTGMIVG